jgi:hypothetical protein
MRRLFDHDHADRTVPAVFGIYFLWSAGWLFASWQQSDNAVFYEWLWPWFFGAAGLVCLAYAIRPWSLHLFAWSAGMMAGACVSRSIAVLLTIADGKAPVSDARSWVAVATWVAFGYALSLVWIVFLWPLNHLRRK